MRPVAIPGKKDNNHEGHTDNEAETVEINFPMVSRINGVDGKKNVSSHFVQIEEYAELNKWHGLKGARTGNDISNNVPSAHGLAKLNGPFSKDAQHGVIGLLENGQPGWVPKASPGHPATAEDVLHNGFFR